MAGGKRVAKKSSEEASPPEKDVKRAVDKARYPLKDQWRGGGWCERSRGLLVLGGGGGCVVEQCFPALPKPLV